MNCYDCGVMSHPKIIPYLEFLALRKYPSIEISVNTKSAKNTGVVIIVDNIHCNTANTYLISLKMYEVIYAISDHHYFSFFLLHC